MPSVVDTSRYVPRPVRSRSNSAAQIDSAACNPPPAPSAIVAPGMAGPPS